MQQRRAFSIRKQRMILELGKTQSANRSCFSQVSKDWIRVPFDISPLTLIDNANLIKRDCFPRDERKREGVRFY